MKRPTTWLLLVSLVTAACAGRGEGRIGTVSELLRPGRRTPLLVAHRGLSARYPENTLAAFRAALDAGAEMIELDVTLSRDGAVIVLHDETLERTTDGSGPPGGLTLEELRRLDAGSWFAAGFAGERIPLLAEVLDLVRGRCALNVEIKPEAVTGSEEGGIEDKVVALVRERGMQRQVLVSSFHPRAVARVGGSASAIRAAWLFHEAVDFDPVARLKELGADGLNLNFEHVSAEIVAQLHAAGLTLVAYTVNDASSLRRIAGLGVDAIFTDDVEAARGILDGTR